jgi:flagellar protein FlgJ
MDKIKGFDPGLTSVLTRNAESKPALNDPKEAAEQFEALILQEMLKSMWQTVPQDGVLSGSNEEATYRDMLNQAIAESVARGRGVGIKEVIANDISKLQKK